MPTALLSRATLTKLAIGVLILLVLNSMDMLLGYPYYGITRFIHLDSDQNFSAWYSSVLLFVAGLISLECHLFRAPSEAANKLTLLLFSLLLIALSADEIAQFHEILGGYASKYIGIADKDFAHRSAWVWIGGPLVAATFAFFAWRMAGMLKETPMAMGQLILGFACIVLGGVVLESTINFLDHNELQNLWRIEVIAEEILEMTGSVLIAFAMMHLRDATIQSRT